MSDLLDPRPTVGDTNLHAQILADPANALSYITAYRMDSTLGWIDQYTKMRERALAAEGKHAKLLIALKGHESALKKIGEENK